VVDVTGVLEVETLVGVDGVVTGDETMTGLEEVLMVTPLPIEVVILPFSM
jgi:hypothetical protein